jgi:hypothetical protein
MESFITNFPKKQLAHYQAAIAQYNPDALVIRNNATSKSGLVLKDCLALYWKPLADKKQEGGLGRFWKIYDRIKANYNEPIMVQIAGNEVFIDDLQKDVDAAIAKGLKGEFAFTPETVQGLLDKIVEAQCKIQLLKEVISDITN